MEVPGNMGEKRGRPRLLLVINHNFKYNASFNNHNIKDANFRQDIDRQDHSSGSGGV